MSNKNPQPVARPEPQLSELEVTALLIESGAQPLDGALLQRLLRRELLEPQGLVDRHGLTRSALAQLRSQFGRHMPNLDRDRMIIRAYQAGETLRAICSAFNLSRTRVQAIVALAPEGIAPPPPAAEFEQQLSVRARHALRNERFDIDPDRAVAADILVRMAGHDWGRAHNCGKLTALEIRSWIAERLRCAAAASEASPNRKDPP